MIAATIRFSPGQSTCDSRESQWHNVVVSEMCASFLIWLCPSFCSVSSVDSPWIKVISWHHIATYAETLNWLHLFIIQMLLQFQLFFCNKHISKEATFESYSKENKLAPFVQQILALWSRWPYCISDLNKHYPLNML